MKLAAIVVCGGQSQRMGRPKAWLPFGPERLLQRVVRRVSEAADLVLIVAAPDQDLPPLPTQVRVVADLIPGQGPLQALSTGLEELPHDVEFAFLTATDVPFVEPRWITRLAQLIGENDLAIPHHEGFHHPLAALYRRHPAAIAAQELLDHQKNRPAFLIEKLRTRIVTATDMIDIDPTLHTLRNLNSPEDYLLALREAGFEDQSPID